MRHNRRNRHLKSIGLAMIGGLLVMLGPVTAQARASLEQMDQKLDQILEELEFIKDSLIFPGLIPRDRFDATATTVDFDTFPCAAGLPSVPGLTLSSPNSFTGMAGATDSPPPGCQTWGATSSPGRQSVFFNGLTIDPDVIVTRIGFVFGGNTSNSVQVNLYRGGVVTSSFTITSEPGAADGVNNWVFYGFQDVNGIDAVELEPSGLVVGIFDIVYE